MSDTETTVLIVIVVAALLLAALAGPKLYTNLGGANFRDDSHLLQKEPGYNLTAVAWLDHDGDGRPDLLLGNGFHGLRLYRNAGPVDPGRPPLAFGPWYYCGPFDNPGNRAFESITNIGFLEKLAQDFGAKATVVWTLKLDPRSKSKATAGDVLRSYGKKHSKAADRRGDLRKLEAEQLKNLPPSTLAALAQDTTGAGQIGVRYAAAPSMEQSVGI